MIADLKPYPAMKGSGVPWLGEVQEGWEVRRIKALFREKDGDVLLVRGNGNIRLVGKAGVVEDDIP